MLKTIISNVEDHSIFDIAVAKFIEEHIITEVVFKIIPSDNENLASLVAFITYEGDA